MRKMILAVAAAALLSSPVLAAGTTMGPKKPSKMGECAKQWKALGDKGQQAYKDKAKGMKSKKGNSLSGYNAWTAECMKKA